MAKRGAGRAMVWRRRAVAMAALAAALAAGYFLWLRDSSLVAVEDVKVTGVTANRDAVTEALEREAREMTTLHVDIDALSRTAQQFPTVASISADASLLHGLEIAVTERLPVAVAQVGGRQVAVSGDGYLLRSVDFDPKKLPPLQVEGSPTGRLGLEGREQAAILAAAPEQLREEVGDVTYDSDRGGVVAQLTDGPELRFGDSSEAGAKWAAAAAVLASRDLGAPTYVDVSVPERPVSGGAAG